ncbi:mechanosensitive ion channel family protein [Candidatus Rariloculus sp.]|uniref:mechanosensitive ion channel family protein n=1 Tax=Candidatus Rariloculus sp. TaxID=3101265 RepID=UPI003D133205
MNEFFSPERLAELGGFAYQWILVNVLVLDSAVQLAIVVAAWGIARWSSRRLRPQLERLRSRPGTSRVIDISKPLLLPLIWLVLQWLAIATASTMAWADRLLITVASLLTAWVAIRLVSHLAKHDLLSKAFTLVAWSIAALNILDLLDPTIAVLDAIAITLGTLRISVFTVVQSTLALAVLLWIAMYLTRVLEARIRTVTALSPSVQVLFAKSLKTVLIGLAILIAIDSVGIDLTALAVVGGAIGLGIGFGLQKVIGNLISGVILLLDKSIKPGDVIAVSGTYGWVTALGGRYVSVVTRDGVEHLIPNETLISERVENWTHTHNQTRLKLDVGVHYDTDVRRAIDLCTEAAGEVDRVLDDPEPKCLLVGFGDSSVELQVRFWIADAHNGVTNVKSPVLLRIWDKFKAEGIEIPYPQRDLHLRSGAQLVTPAFERESSLA